MLVDISTLRKKQISKIDVNTQLNNDEIFKDNNEIAISSPLDIEGSLKFVDDILYFEYEVKGYLQLKCGRCLEYFKYFLEQAFTEKYCFEEGKYDEALLLEDDMLNITEAIEENIEAYLPIKRLCDDHCKGLCQNCGTNLNRSACKCTGDIIDERLAKLKELFPNN